MRDFTLRVVDLENGDENYLDEMEVGATSHQTGIHIGGVVKVVARTTLGVTRMATRTVLRIVKMVTRAIRDVIFTIAVKMPAAITDPLGEPLTEVVHSLTEVVHSLAEFVHSLAEVITLPKVAAIALMVAIHTVGKYLAWFITVVLVSLAIAVIIMSITAPDVLLKILDKFLGLV